MTAPFKIQIAAILLFGMALIIFLHLLGVLKPAETTLIAGLKPIQQALYPLASRWGLGDWGGPSVSFSDLEKENQRLRDQVNNSLVENLRLKERVLAMEAINEQMKFLDEQGLIAVGAKVIGRSSDQVSSSLLLNQGSDHGIAVGMPVVVEQGIMIGKISEVESKSSKVQLLTTAGAKTSAIVLSENEVQGIVEGQHGLSVKLTFVLQTETIRPNDVVVTSGEEQLIPKNLVLGTVSEVNKAPGELWQSATLELPVRSNDIQIVSIIRTDRPQ